MNKTGGKCRYGGESNDCVSSNPVDVVLMMIHTCLIRLFAIIPFLTFSVWMVMAPQVGIYTSLVCKVIRLDYPNGMHLRYAPRESFSVVVVKDAFVVDAFGKQPSRDTCATDPVVQAGVSKLIAGMFASTCSIEFSGELVSLNLTGPQ
jgi:hypothetical protein